MKLIQQNIQQAMLNANMFLSLNRSTTANQYNAIILDNVLLQNNLNNLNNWNNWMYFNQQLMLNNQLNNLRWMNFYCWH
jgi:hypothetical protein